MKLLTLTLVMTSLFLTACAGGYTQYYKPVSNEALQRIASSRLAPAPATPSVERLQSGNPETILNAYMKRGYVRIGSSFFNSGREQNENSAIRQGKDVGADLVLILSPRYIGSVTTSVPITTPTTATAFSTASTRAYGPAGSVTAYGNSNTTIFGSTTNYVPITIDRSEYSAVYFVKQRFALGLFSRDLNDDERQKFQTNKGTIAVVVVDETPAFNADILVGDMITAVDGQDISNTVNFYNLVRAKSTQKVLFTILRGGQRIEKTVQVGVM